MPWQPPAQPKCPVCGKSAYPAEATQIKVNDAVQWIHNTCFKCIDCGLRLTLTTYKVSDFGDPELFCGKCVPKQAPSQTADNVDTERTRKAAALFRDVGIVNQQVRGAEETIGVGASSASTVDTDRARKATAIVSDVRIINEQVKLEKTPGGIYERPPSHIDPSSGSASVQQQEAAVVHSLKAAQKSEPIPNSTVKQETSDTTQSDGNSAPTSAEDPTILPQNADDSTPTPPAADNTPPAAEQEEDPNLTPGLYHNMDEGGDMKPAPEGTVDSAPTSAPVAQEEDPNLTPGLYHNMDEGGDMKAAPEDTGDSTPTPQAPTDDTSRAAEEKDPNLTPGLYHNMDEGGDMKAAPEYAQSEAVDDTKADPEDTTSPTEGSSVADTSTEASSVEAVSETTARQQEWVGPAMQLQLQRVQGKGKVAYRILVRVMQVVELDARKLQVQVCLSDGNIDLKKSFKKSDFKKRDGDAGATLELIVPTDLDPGNVKLNIRLLDTKEKKVPLLGSIAEPLSSILAGSETLSGWFAVFKPSLGDPQGLKTVPTPSPSTIFSNAALAVLTSFRALSVDEQQQVLSKLNKEKQVASMALAF